MKPLVGAPVWVDSEVEERKGRMGKLGTFRRIRTVGGIRRRSSFPVGSTADGERGSFAGITTLRTERALGSSQSKASRRINVQGESGVLSPVLSSYTTG